MLEEQEPYVKVGTKKCKLSLAEETQQPHISYFVPQSAMAAQAYLGFLCTNFSITTSHRTLLCLDWHDFSFLKQNTVRYSWLNLVSAVI